MARDNVTFSDLVAVARRVGVTVVEAPSSHRGKLGSMGTVRGVTCHHTGTANSLRPTEEYLDFNVVKEGRAGLENSLSAFGLGRWTTIFVFSEFLSWHAGTWSYAGITDGNGHFLGIEAAGVGDWTPFQREVYPRLVASILLFINEPATMAPTHAMGATPPGRKTDAANFAWFDERVRFFMANPAFININYSQSEVPDMTDDQAKALTEILGNSRSTNAVINDLNVAVRDPSGGLVASVAKLTGQVAGLTTAVSQLQGGGVIDPGAINAASEQGAAKALDGLAAAIKAANS